MQDFGACVQEWLSFHWSPQGPEGQVRGKCRVPSPRCALWKVTAYWGFHQSLCGSCHICSSPPVKALVPALPAVRDYQLSSFSITLITQASKEVSMLAALLFPCIWSTGRVERGRRNMCWLHYLSTAPEAHAGFLNSQTCGIASMASCPLSP